MSNSGHQRELESERERIEFLYRRLDLERQAADQRLAAALRGQADSDSTATWHREVAVDSLSAQVSQLRAAERGLCFGRVDERSGECTYLGRVGLFDQDNDYEPLLVDWRAPAARPFYCATPANPDGLTRRRHFHTRGRELLDFHDDFLDAGPHGESALLAAVSAPRTGAMSDIVATIQAEQDEVIRLDPAGVLVVEGAPGTGKTAVALHRVAYLLYTQRERLSRRGVLVVGPTTGFLRYIGGVLPALGETAVVFATPGELFPGVRTEAVDHPVTARVKGRTAMVDVLAAAVADRQTLPSTPIDIELADVTVPLDDTVAALARDRARASGLRHNLARRVFVETLIAELTPRAVDLIGAGWLQPRDNPGLAADLTADVRTELVGSTALRTAANRLWPLLSPRRLLADLFSSPERLAVAGAALPDEERDALYRERGAPWTVSDVPLLDEAVELLGPQTAQRDSTERAERDYAEGVLQILDTDEDPDGELLRAVDLVDASRLAERHARRDHRELAERAAADREWTFGHVVVDEAQELSEMDWRVLFRRCPSRSMTVVGDLVQRQSPAGARAWRDILAPHVADRWRHRRLTVNYRTPAEIMAVAAEVLAEVDPDYQPPRSIRSTGVAPWTRQVAREKLADEVCSAVAAEAKHVQGTVAVIAPADVVAELSDMDCPVLAPPAAKGLEFDGVIVVDPDRIRADGERGAAELYVAFTRPTHRLGILQTSPA